MSHAYGKNKANIIILTLPSFSPIGIEVEPERAFIFGTDSYDLTKEGLMATKAYILMKVKAGKSQEVLNTLKALPGVEQAHACFGQPDIFGLINAPDDRTLSDLIMAKIHTIPGVEETDTHIVVQE